MAKSVKVPAQQLTTIIATQRSEFSPSDPSTPAPPAKGIPSSLLTAFGTEEQTSFKRRVYDAQIVEALSQGKKFFPGLPPGDLASFTLPGDKTPRQLRKDVVPSLLALFKKAVFDLAAEKQGGDEHASRVSKDHDNIGICSAYRDPPEDFRLWDGYFKQYYEATEGARQRAVGGEHSDAAVGVMVRYVRNLKAAPGFSNHTKGIAVDFSTKEHFLRVKVKGTDQFVATTEHIAASHGQDYLWADSWLHAWLVKNAATYGFKPLATENWHWDHRGVALAGGTAVGVEDDRLA